MNSYVAAMVARERMQDRVDEAATQRLLTRRRRARTTRAGAVISTALLAMSRRLITASNRLRAAGEQQYAVQACCVA